MAKRQGFKMASWDLVSDRLEEIKRRNSVFIRLEDDGDSVIVAFVGEPRIREVHWTGAEYKDCEGEGCALCARNVRATAKVMLNAFEQEMELMRVFECGASTFKTVLKAVKKYGLAWWFEVERQGAKGDPKTTYTVLPEAALTDKDAALVDQAPLHDLYNLGSDDFPKDDEEDRPRSRKRDDDERPRSRRPARIERTREAAPEDDDDEPAAPEPEPDPEPAPAPRPKARVARPAVVTPPPAGAGDDFNPFG
jgi:hypothetical protein